MAKKKNTKKSVTKNCNPPGRRADRVYNQNTRLPWFKQGYLMLRANEVNAPLRDFHSQSGYIKKLKLPKKSGNSPVNFLTTNPQILDFFKGGSLDYSQLVPHVEINKVYISKGNGGIKNIEERTFPFGSLTNWDDMSQSIKKSGRLFRGTEAGIQQVDIKMEGRGRNPVSANVLDIVVKYYFNDVKTLFEPLSLAPLKGNSEQTSYADLIRFPKWNKDYNDFTQRAFRIRLVLGWAMEPQVDKSKLLDQNPGFIGAVLGSKMSIAADLYTHSMEFNENGSLILTAKYKGALETAFGDADILNAGIAPGEKSSTVTELKQKIRAAEDKFVAGGYTKRGAGTRNAFKNILAIERAVEDLQAARKALEGASSPDDKTFSNVRAALKRLTEAYTKYNQNRSKSPLAQLQGAARTTSILEKNKLERENEAKLAKLKKRYEKGARSRKAKKLKRAITRLRNELKKYQKTIKGKYIFSYVEKLQEQNKLAYISTGRGTSFGNYRALLDALKKYGGSEEESDKQKIEKAKAEARRAEGGTLKGALPDFDTRISRRYTRQRARFDSTELFGGGGLGETPGGLLGGSQLTVAPEFAPVVEPLTLRQQAEQVTNPDLQLTTSHFTRRRRTEHGDSILWENVRNPKYKKGAKTYFFRLGDLLTVILENGDFGKKLNEQAPNFKLLLGEYDIPQDNDQIVRMNLYDLPISLEIFHVFVAQKIVGTGRAVYPFLKFTFDLIKFVMDKTQNVFGKSAEFMDAELLPVSFKMDVTSLDLPAQQIKKLTKNGTLDVIRLDGKGENDKARHLNTLSVDKIKNTSSTFLFHAHKRVSKTGSSMYNGNIKEDEKRGIFHFFVGGPQRGIMKRINFTQAGNNLFSMALMRNGQAGGAESSREGIIQPSKFAVEVTMVGNPFFYIGQMFYVNTDLISGGHFKDNGILNGGYYIVTEVTSNFRADRWETKIKGTLNIPDHALAKNKNTDGSVELMSKLEKEELARYKAQLAAKPKPVPALPDADRVGAWVRRNQRHELGSDGNCYKAGTKLRRHKSRCKGG